MILGRKSRDNYKRSLSWVKGNNTEAASTHRIADRRIVQENNCLGKEQRGAVFRFRRGIKARSAPLHWRWLPKNAPGRGPSSVALLVEPPKGRGGAQTCARP